MFPKFSKQAFNRLAQDMEDNTIPAEDAFDLRVYEKIDNEDNNVSYIGDGSERFWVRTENLENDIPENWQQVQPDAYDDWCRYSQVGVSFGVKLGGSPMSNAEWYDSIEDAEEAAINMAKDMADEDEIDTIEIYGGINDPTGWGACPENNSGAYWPEILVKID